MSTAPGPIRRWLVDGNNVYGSKPDGWWNDRAAATRRFAQRVAEWCRTHADDVIVVFDAPLPAATFELAGGNLTIVEAPRRGRDGADDHLVELAAGHVDDPDHELVVVSSDRGLRRRLPSAVVVMGVGRFRSIVGY